MLFLNHSNVLVGFESKTNMMVICPNHTICRDLFRRACDLFFHDEEGSYIRKNEYHLEIKFVAFRVRSMEEQIPEIRGFQGVIMIHPKCILDPIRYAEHIAQIEQHNIRYIKPWQP